MSLRLLAAIALLFAFSSPTLLASVEALSKPETMTCHNADHACCRRKVAARSGLAVTSRSSCKNACSAVVATCAAPLVEADLSRAGAVPPAAQPRVIAGASEYSVDLLAASERFQRPPPPSSASSTFKQ